MHLEGTVTVNAPRESVWAYLTDPHKVSECAPGVESVDVVIPGHQFRATAAVGFGSIKVRFTGDVEWLELEAPNRARMKAHGNAPGSAADVFSEMQLSDGANGGTELRWTADITVVGQIASLAARLMTSVSQKLVGVFFDCVRQKIETGQQPAAGIAQQPATAEAQTAGMPSDPAATEAPAQATPPGGGG